MESEAWPGEPQKAFHSTGRKHHYSTPAFSTLFVQVSRSLQQNLHVWIADQAGLPSLHHVSALGRAQSLMACPCADSVCSAYACWFQILMPAAAEFGIACVPMQVQYPVNAHAHAMS
jgi:hypothetical protein